MKPLLFIALLSLFGKPVSEIRIPYRELTWADYRGSVPENEPDVAARTCTQMELEIEQIGGKYHFRVLAYVLADSSFVRLRDDKTLHHEQTHFKITCIEALKCNRALAPLQEGDSTRQTTANDLYNHYFDEAAGLQDKFDQETNHSLNAVAEKTWEEKISRELRIFETPIPKRPWQKPTR